MKTSGRSISCCETGVEIFNVLLLHLTKLQLLNCVRAVDFNAMAITHAFVFVVTTHTVVLQITVLLLLLLGGGGGETDSKDLFVFLFDFTLS